MIIINTRFDGVSVAFVLTSERIVVTTSRPDIATREVVKSRVADMYDQEERHMRRMIVVDEWEINAVLLAIEYTLADLGLDTSTAERYHEELLGAL